ncbi:lysophospholipid acyltransferase family protein [Nocardioides sp.]|uniref:lysophospholipid acyltransferase family protein n=1 Tax=Nocardioides sp. TaxID=35761 RepID=UPI00262FD669|nr:lysophospholipid acyltransferase family protein [Nocardioides sp.]
MSVPLVKPFLKATTKQRWEGAENIPTSGGVILAMNHVSHIDPLTAAHITWDHGRLSRYLAKASLFKIKVVGPVLRAAGQIPVERASAGADALKAAIDAVNDGKLIVVYVEGSITKDPDGWPMVGKSGAARIALATGAPVIPVGQWGAQFLFNGYEKKFRPFPRKLVQMKVGTPIDLSDLEHSDRPAVEDVNLATDRIMSAIVGLVADIRGEEPPAELYDPRKARKAAREAEQAAKTEPAEQKEQADPGAANGSDGVSEA